MDIRSFFKAAGKTGGGAAAGAVPKKPKQSQDVKASQEPAAAAPKPAAAAATPPAAAKKASTPSKRSSQSAGNSSQGGAAGKAKAGKGTAAASRKRKKAVIDSDSDVEIVDDDSDEDFDAMSLDDEDQDDDVIALDDGDSEEEEPKPKPAKRAKTTPAAAPAAAAKGKASKATPAKGRGKKDRPAMVIEKGTQDTAEKKRKLPGSMAGQTASQIGAPKTAAKGKKAAPGAMLSDEAQQAMALVEVAAAELPELEESSLTFAPTAIFGGGGGMEERPPPEAGSKDVVRGHPDAFTGKTFVFSGVLSSLYRDVAKDLVLSHGGRVTGDVSGKTSFLVVGDQCSRRKFHKAVEKGCKVVDEDGFLSLAAASASLAPDQQQGAAVPAAAASSQPPAAAAAAASQQAAAAAGAQPSQQQQQPAGAGSGRPAVPVMSSMAFHGTSGGAAGAGPSRGAAAAAAGAVPARAGGANLGDTLWVEKYKPQSAQELVGNNSHVATLRQWLHQWEDVHLRGATPVQPRTGGGYQAKPKDMTKKAVLLSGPPGIGKTSSAHIVAKELGFQVVEVNASDARGKSDNKATSGIAGKLSNIVREMVTSTALAAASGVKRKQVLIMDEVDGMSAGDRGGVADLINTIKMSKIPIICICNDKYVQKLRSLRNHTLELDFRKATAPQVAARMHMVCRNEGLAINDATLQALIAGAQGDIRLVLGQLQMARLRNNSLDYNSAKAMTAISKDADMSPFNACSKLFESHRMGNTANPPSITERLEWVFSDADLVPLLVQENYANYSPDLVQNAPLHMRLRVLAKAAESISMGDVVNCSVRRYGNWGLMPFGAMMGSVVPATYMRGRRETYNEYEQNFTRFSSWFGNYSHGNKQHRLLAELSCAMAAGDTGATCSRNSVRRDYLPALRQVLTRPLATEGEAAIPQVISVMQAYCINREQFDFILDVTKFKSKAEWAEDPMKDIDTKTKSAFTRTFNKQGLKARTSAMVPDVVTKGKGKGRGKAAAAAAADDDGEEVDAVAGDAEGGAALAEEAAAPTTQARASDDADEEGLDPEQLAARMRQEGISLELKAPAAAGKSGGRGGASGGRGRGGGRSGGGASGRGGRSGGRGKGRGK